MLGDVVEVVAQGAQADKLANIELFPSPPPGQQRTVRVRELQDLLANRGVSLVEHRFSGASQVVVAGLSEMVPAAEMRPVSPSAVKRAERVVNEAITKFLETEVSAEEKWQVDAKLTEAQARLIPADSQRVSVAGGEAPWTGIRNFEISVDEGGHPTSFTASATVSQRARVVVAVKAIARGETIRTADLQLRRPDAVPETAEVFHALDEVVGMEAVQTIPAGGVLQKSLLRSPVLVRRGEVITVYSRSSGIRIRVTARAREDAALGDLVAIESLTDRKAYTARVCGLQEAEIYARAMQPRPASQDQTTPRVAGGSARNGGRISK